MQATDFEAATPICSPSSAKMPTQNQPGALRTAMAVPVALIILFNPLVTVETRAAVSDSPQAAALDDAYNQIADLDKKMKDILNEPVDFCDPQAVKGQTMKYDHFLFEKHNLKRKVEKWRTSIKDDVDKVVQAFAEDDLLPHDQPHIAEYRDALQRRDSEAEARILKTMTPAARAQAADERKDFVEEIDILTPLADSGDVASQAWIAGLYNWAKTLDDAKITLNPPAARPPRDDALAFKYFRLAAAGGDSFSQLGVAKAYACGTGTEKNLVKAYAWFSVAASQSAVTVRTYYEPEDILHKRDFIAAQMSHDEVQDAKHLLVRCYKSGYKDCEFPSVQK